MGESRRVLFISENAPVPADRRVWNEARSLTAAGWAVTIVCAQGTDRDAAPFEVLEGIEIHRFPLAPASGGPVSYLREYAQAMWRIRLDRAQAGAHAPVRRRARAATRRTSCCSRRAACAAAGRASCSTITTSCRSCIAPASAAGTGPLYRVALALEQVAFRLADVTIATNESYRRIAVERGRMAPEDVFVVRNGPNLARFRPVSRRPVAAARPRAPDRLPGDHGAAGRHRPRDPRARLAQRPRRLARDLHRRRRRAGGHARARDRPRASPTAWSSPAGATTTTSARSSRPPTSALRRIRRARSTTSRR